MIGKPTPGELQRLVARLEKESAERERLETALAESEERRRTLVEASSDAILELDPERRILSCNQAFLSLFGYERSEVEGRSVRIIYGSDESFRAFEDKIRTLATTEGTCKTERSYVHKDGASFPAETIAAARKTSDGSVRGYVEIIRDITKSRLTEEALRASEMNYRLIIENANESIIVAQDGMIAFANPNALKSTHYTAEELTSRPFIDFIHPDDRKMVYARYLERLSGKASSGPYVFRMLNRKGDSFWVEVNAVLSSWQDRPATVSFLTDVTERIRREEALKASEERYRDLYDNAPVGYHEIDTDGRITRVNRTELDMMGYTAQEVVGRYMWEFVAEEEAGSRLRAKLSGEVPVGIPFGRTFRKKDGTPVPVLIEERLVRSQEGQIVGIRSTIQDISGVKQAEERIHVLSQELMQAHERERQIISLELHDRVAQDLSIVKIGLDTLLYSLPGISAELKKQVSDLSGVIQKTISAVRDLAYDLRPPSLDQLGLVQSMYQYCEEFSQKSGLAVEFTCAGMDELSLDSDAEINLYRLVQEGLINVRKHAEASHVFLRLVASHPDIILRILDDGKGFDVEERRRSLTRERRMGLRSMEERVRWLGGSIDVKSSPGKGTRIAIRIPHKEKEGAKKENSADRG
ncbi:MAG: PAS domain S-box protein [Deltaproteobacteria bacterium]|nr:PAS domain S-box protein [Deltaproteobacteria bacterium]